MGRPSFESDFRALFAERYSNLFRYLNRISADPDLAADAAQEAFVRLYRRGTMPEEPRVWLVTVAHNVLRDVLRAGRRRRRLLELHQASDPEPEDRSAPGASLEAAECRHQVRAALQLLPERERQMLLLRHEGYSYREIAGALGIAESSVGTLLARAGAAFRSSYLRSHGAPE
jgi:RNA polymerase sigma factor (sigma-70 family)